MVKMCSSSEGVNKYTRVLHYLTNYADRYFFLSLEDVNVKIVLMLKWRKSRGTVELNLVEHSTIIHDSPFLYKFSSSSRHSSVA